MVVRNFWIEAVIDGQETVLKGGPRSKEGGLRVVVKQRDKGEVTVPITIDSFVNTHGKLQTNILVEGEVIHSHITER